jgi:N-acylglucosamine 2-epimerase
MLEPFGEIYRRELLDSVVPFWMKHSLDPEHGGFFTCLDRRGEVYDTRKYVWLQGRQVWTLCRLYNQVEPRAEWLDAARRGLEFLRRHAHDPEGRIYFSLTRDGRPAGYQRKPYAAVFYCIGLSEYYRATGEERALAESIALYDRIQRWIAEPALLGRPALPGAPAFRQLADLMVVASMSLELHAARPDTRYVAAMRTLIARILEHYDPDRRILL